MNAEKRAGIRKLATKTTAAKERLYEVQVAILVGMSPTEPVVQKAEEALSAIGRLQDALEELLA